MELKCYFHNKFIPLAEASVPVSDRAFLYGDGLFETLRVYKGCPFYGKEHLLRLQEGAAALSLTCKGSLEEMAAILKETIRINKIEEGFLRVTLSRGTGKRGLYPAGCHEPLLVVMPFTSIPYKEQDYEEGFKGIIVESTRRNSFSPFSRLKSLNYLDNIIAKMETQDKGADEGLLLNISGELACGTVTNLFMVKGKEIYTPGLSSGVLKGVTRQIVLRLARDNNHAVKEEPFFIRDLTEAHEAFLTNSLLELMPLISIDNQPVGNGKPGEITKGLRNKYLNHVERYCEQQKID